MKEGWVYKKLGDIATIRRGLTYKKEDEVEKSNKIVLRSNNVDLETHQLIFDELKYLKDDFDIPEEKILKKGDLLMCMSNGSKIHLGKVALIEQNTHFAFGGFMSAIEHNKSVLDKFFYYALISPNFKQHIKELQDGANINNLKIRDIESFSIPIPSLSEQQRIVSYLDAEFAKIEALKANAEKQLQAAKDLFQAALKELMMSKEGWVEKKLVEEFSLKSGDYLPTKEQKEGTIPVYGGNGITGYHNLYNLSGEQILIGRVGALCGNIHYVNENIWVTDNAFVLTNISENWYKLFLVYELGYLNLNQFASQTAQPVISNKSMKDVIIAQPHISEQQRIADRLDALSANVKALQTNYTETITLCNDLKQALLKKVFG